MPNHHIEVQMIPVLLYIACQGDNTQPKPIEKSATSTIPIEKITFTKERLRPSDHVLCVDTNNDGQPNYVCLGPDMNRDGIPDVPIAPPRVDSSKGPKPGE